MKTKLAALASAILAIAFLAPGVEAGGGVRLGFGGPLGTFTATPAHGGGAYHRPRMKRKAPVAQAARKPGRTPRVAKAEAPVRSRVAVAKPAVTAPAVESEARVTGSSALIQGAIPADERQVHGTQTGPVADVETAGRPADGASAVAGAPEASRNESKSCRKFIPAVGMTVSVGCGDE